ncbi:hypothetical protein MTsPCn9_13830 [Croceitalea sp. MTPC9]|uniref:hypothetical protein n=1 Tax=unclassified Croceitalea TaxID=2632280 RepID=UPI002B39FBCF|nr:hypothetical protein MTsPCn6_15300 [Croceitalea sp. MTPC6]GMN16447.1 hypothetical protein MTsPCn9_13830 [Croceitalea sp. MTPC9]
MRKTIIFSVVVFLMVMSVLWSQKSNVEIASGSSIELDYPNYKMYELQLKNNTGAQIDVEVQNKETGEFVRGFGLGPLGKVEVMVEQGSKITFTNNSNKMGKISVKMLNTDVKLKPKSTRGQSISFKLINPSNKAIPLIIPNVMNPNLSPNSSSGVDLKIGQELLFRNGLKKYVLLTVDETIKEGQELDVYELLQQRKKELGLKQ